MKKIKKNVKNKIIKEDKKIEKVREVLIDNGKKEKIDPPHPVEKSSFATHVPLLTRVFDQSEGDVLEIGTGYFSTLLLHWLAEMTKRHVYSYENRFGWYTRARRMESTYHHIIYCPSWDEAPFEDKHWGLVFVDHGPDNRRPVEIERLKDKTDYMVIHDTDIERDEMYGYSKVLPKFKYRYDYKKIWPYTSVVSNFKKLDNIE